MNYIDFADFYEPSEDFDPYDIYEIDPLCEKLHDLITRYELVMDFGYKSHKTAPLSTAYSSSLRFNILASISRQIK